MTCRYRRNPRGTRAVAAVSHGHRKTGPSVAALRTTGIITPVMFDRTMNADSFRCPCAISSDLNQSN